jgi:UDPglucose 6-dehydrogenase
VADGADGVVMCTEWNEYKQLDLARVRSVMRTPVLIDGRNVYDPARMRDLGFVYRAMGRGQNGD